MKEYTVITSTDQVDRFIKDHPLSFIYISRENCGVCTSLFPKIRNLLTKFPNIRLGFIDADQVTEIAGKFSVFTVPVLLFFVDGKEVLREARFVHTDALEKQLEKIYELAGNN